MSPRDSSHRPPGTRKTGAHSSSRAARKATASSAGEVAGSGPTGGPPSDAVAAFLATQPFPLDPFQIEAAEHLAAGRSVLVAAPTGTGKALEVTTPVLTPLGWKPISEICVGDSVIGSQGNPVTVLGVYPQGKRPAYRVTFSDDVSVICDIDHLWAVNTKWRRSEDSPWRVLSLRQIMAEGLTDGEGRRHFIPIVKPVEFCQPEIQRDNSLSAIRQETGVTQRGLATLLGVSQGFVTQRELGYKVASEEYRQAVESTLAEVGPQPRLDPYLLGLLLGDGNISSDVVRFTSADDEIISSVREMIPRGTILQKAPTRPHDWFILSDKARTRNPLVTELVKLGLMRHRAEDKFIPHQYKFASVEDRVAILQGLLDSDGSIDACGLIEYSTVSRVLAEDVVFLVRSLGGRTRIKERPTTRLLSYRLLVNLPDGISPFRLTRKRTRCRSARKYYPTRSIHHIEPVGEAEMVCISVDAPDGLFVINDFIVTHNTIVAEFAIWQARRAGQRAIYTAPIKALSNQKFRDLRQRHGVQEVGLLTGDIVENPAAPIVVMTTEIYRNMLLEGARAARMTVTEEANALLAPVRSRGHRQGDEVMEASDVAEMARRAAIDEELSGVGCVIFDELHFLSDPERGPVWEEAIIHSPAHVLFAGLSATVSNANELRRWIEAVHGPMALVFHDERAVPLEHFFFFEKKLHLVQNAEGQRVERFLGIGGEARRARLMQRGKRADASAESYPRLVDTLREPASGDGARQPGTPGKAGKSGQAGQAGQPEQPELPQERPAPEPGEVVTALRAANMLPCLYFLPGRRAVEAAAASAAGHLLVSPEDRTRLHDQVQQWVRTLPPEDQKLDQVRRLATLLPRGLGFHHAGLLPALKVMVETLFARGDLKAVFATDTLALGINMPARTVVVGSLSKFDGRQMRLLTPNEYQQLTGRAGRRGMDAHGSAVLLYSPWDVFEPAFASLTAPLLPVTSAFTVRYNTILNLWRPGDYGRLRTAVASSLREFQRRGGRAAKSRADDEYALYRSKRKKKAQREPYTGLSRAASEELNATVYVLRMMGYIGEDDELTVRGWMLRAIFHPAGMVLTELTLSGALDGLNPGELAEVFSWFTYDSSDRSLHNLYTLPRNLMEVRRDIWKTLRLVQTLEFEQGVTISPGIVESFHSVALNWWRGGSLRGLLNHIELAEGDLLVVLNQTIDLLQQVQGAVGQVLDARALWQQKGTGRRQARAQEEMRLRLEDMRGLLADAWRHMLRGSVALSRAIPSMAAPSETAEGESELPAIPMAEDEDVGEVRGDRAEDTASADNSAVADEPEEPQA